MSFWEKIKNNMEVSTQGAVQQTRAIAETMKLESRVSSIEKQIEQQYTLIGKRYYELHAEDPETELKNSIDNVRAYMEEISKLKTQLYKAKGVVICPNCGKESAENVQFCAFCGERIPKRVSLENNTNEKTRCSQCGAEISANQKFCTNCGFAVDAAEGTRMSDVIKPSQPFEIKVDCEEENEKIEIPEEALPQNSIDENDATSTEKDAKQLQQNCPNCGQPYAEGQAFCMKCGWRLNS